MPELPEVETTRRMIEKYCAGKRIERVEVVRPELLKSPTPEPTEFSGALRGVWIQNVLRRGKHLIFELDNGYAVLTHLKMRGSFRFVSDSSVAAEPYLGVEFFFDDGSSLRYHDIWRWGEFRIVHNVQSELFKHVPALAGMGKEPFDQGFTPKVLRDAALRRARTPIKACLLDQSVVAGVGNIYADEALFRARVRPDRLPPSLSDDEWMALRDAIVQVLTEATEGGGTISDNFVTPEGNPGAYHPRVYGRGGEPCDRCGTPLTRIKITGRGTVYCPNCQ